MSVKVEGDASVSDVVQQAFTTEQVLALTGVTRRKLAYWLDHEVVTADVDRARGRGHVRLFAFRNLLEVRVAVWLRDEVSLQLLRKIVQRFREQGVEKPLADLSFAVLESTVGRQRREVVVQQPDGSWEHGESGQKIMEITVPLRRFAAELETAIEKNWRRRRAVGKVERRRGVLGSTPVLAGTRVPTRAIWALHRAGYDIAQITENYPGLEAGDVQAALDEEQHRRHRDSAGRDKTA